MKGRGRHRRRHRSWRAQVGIALTTAACLVLAYAGGVTYAHWSTEATVQGWMATGSVEHRLLDPPGLFHFDCIASKPSTHPISFIRFWDPSRPPGPLTTAKTGAVKVEEDRVELAPGPYSVDAALSQLGDLRADGSPVGVYLDEISSWITDWTEHPDLSGRYLAFDYEAGEAEVIVDLKAAGELSRTTLSGSGQLWSPGSSTDPGAVVCEPDSQTTRFEIANEGSVPAVVGFGLGSLAGDCELFDVTLSVVATGEIIQAGSLCGLLDNELELIPQLDPGHGELLDLEVTVLAPSAPFDESVEAEITTVLWNSGSPADPDSSLWTDSSVWDIRLTIGVDYPDDWGGDDGDEPSDGDQPQDRDEPEDGDEPDDRPNGDEPDDGDESGGGPNGGEAEELEDGDTRDDEEAEEGDGEEPEDPGAPEHGDGEENDGDDPYDDIDSPAEEEPAPGTDNDSTTSLSGVIWEDLDSDGIRLPGGEEPGVAGAVVVLYDLSGSRVARTDTDERGFYVLGNLEPSEYRVEVHAPESYGFVPPIGEIYEDPDAFLAGLQKELELAPDEIAVGDITQVEFDDEHSTWFGVTETVGLVAGENATPADAALFSLTLDEAPPDPEAVREGDAETDAGLDGVVIKNLDAMATEPEKPEPVDDEDSASIGGDAMDAVTEQPVGGENPDQETGEGEVGQP